MANLTALIVPAKALKNGRHKVRIALSHNCETRYIVTDIILDSDKEFRNGAIVKRNDAAILNTKLRGLLQKYQLALDSIENIKALTCAELVFVLKNGQQTAHRSLQSVYEEYLDSLTSKKSSIIAYKTYWKAISRFLNSSMPIEHVTKSMVIAVGKKIRESSASTTAHSRMAFFSSIISYAIKNGYAQYRVSPFYQYKLPPSEIRQCWLSVDEIKTIRDLNLEKENLIRCRDIFMLSYYLGGINIADIVKINFNENSDVIKYVRTKTENRQKANKYVIFDIPDEAKEIINRYKDNNGFLPVSKSYNPRAANSFMHTNLKQLAKITGIKHLIFYSARKSFSQHAFDLGVEIVVIDYILGHKVDRDGSSLFAYLTIPPEKATAAIRKVLDNLK